jgi:nicotinamidase-related amidase
VIQTAALLIDLQRDFLDADCARMPVDAGGAASVLHNANAILAKRALGASIPVLILNQFPASDRIRNFFRKGAAISGTPGAGLDSRVRYSGHVKVITKSSPSAFTNPELESYLKAQGVNELYVMGVFAEGCVRATVLEALRRGYKVNVITDAVATNRPWKKQFALWAMKRAGAVLLPSVDTSNAS